MDQSSPSLSFLNITASEKGLSEFNGGRRIIFIPKKQIQSIEFKSGSLAERPLAQAIFGLLLLTALGFAGIYLLIENSVYGLRWGLGFLLFGGLGGFMLYEALRKGYFFQVTSSNDSRKLVVKGKIRKEDLSEFINGAGKLGYFFKISPDDRTIPPQ
jgi:hypothetical protein